MQAELDSGLEAVAPRICRWPMPDEALILASIVEKETGREDERPKVAAVFVNRLRLGMRLQSDPTVIYGLGRGLRRHIHTRDLETDTPYNSYTRSGLPPTPIALPGAAALQATLHPAASDALYFVATGDGDGTHQFSATLEQHDVGVARLPAQARAWRRMREWPRLRLPAGRHERSRQIHQPKGIEGAGKSTLARALGALLTRARPQGAGSRASPAARRSPSGCARWCWSAAPSASAPRPRRC